MPDRIAALGRVRLVGAGATLLVIVVAVAVGLAHGGGTAASSGTGARLPGTGAWAQLPAPTASSGTGAAASTLHAEPAPAAGGTRSGRFTPPSSAAWFTVTLGAACVVPGGTQSLAAQSRPGYTVAYNSRYADGSAGNVHGGYGVLPTDSTGRAGTTWTVSADAPLGTVTVSVGTADGGVPATLARSFVVAAHC